MMKDKEKLVALTRRFETGGCEALSFFPWDIVGDIAGDIVGDIVGDNVGDIVGDIARGIAGGIAGDIVGDIAGDCWGHCWGLLGTLLGALLGTSLEISLGTLLGTLPRLPDYQRLQKSTVLVTFNNSREVFISACNKLVSRVHDVVFPKFTRRRRINPWKNPWRDPWRDR